VDISIENLIKRDNLLVMTNRTTKVISTFKFIFSSYSSSKKTILFDLLSSYELANIYYYNMRTGTGF